MYSSPRGRPCPVPIPPEARVTIKTAGLQYVTDARPGISREPSGKNFRYLVEERKVTDAAVLGRIKRLAIPPAWTEVWICPDENGHLQATGRDARKRKQYRYHTNWRAARDETKYERMLRFGRALPKIRRQVAKELRAKGLGRRRVIAAMTRLLETTLIRVGNEEYAKQNHSYGLTTLRNRHVRVRKGTVHFEFRGKSGKDHDIDLCEPRLAKMIRQLQHLPGQELFQYLDEEEKPQKISSEDINGFLHETAGEEFSAKDFRTWAGTILAARALSEFDRFDTKAQAKKNLLEAIEHVADRLGNTPAVCRKCYIHPAVLDSYLNGATVKLQEQATETTSKSGVGKLSTQEEAVIDFLQQQIKKASTTSDLTVQLQRSVGRRRKHD